MELYQYNDGALEPVSETNRLPVDLPEAPSDWHCIKLRVPRSSGATVYTAGDAYGDAFTLEGAVREGRPSLVRAIHVVDLTGQKAAINIHLFDLPITGTADNAAWAVSDADFRNSLGWLPMAATDYSDSSAAAVGTILAEWPIRSMDGTRVYGQIETTGTPTLAATNEDLYLIVWVQYL